MFDRNKESNRKSHLKAGRAGGDVGSEGGGVKQPLILWTGAKFLIFKWTELLNSISRSELMLLLVEALLCFALQSVTRFKNYQYLF